jgi:hypothetical protein
MSPRVTEEEALRAELARITEPAKMLTVLVKAIDDGYFGHDSYFASLAKEWLRRARELSA